MSDRNDAGAAMAVPEVGEAGVEMIKGREGRLDQPTRSLVPGLRSCLGVGREVAAALVVTAGWVRSAATGSMRGGVSPTPAWSGLRPTPPGIGSSRVVLVRTPGHQPTREEVAQTGRRGEGQSRGLPMPRARRRSPGCKLLVEPAGEADERHALSPPGTGAHRQVRSRNGRRNPEATVRSGERRPQLRRRPDQLRPLRGRGGAFAPSTTGGRRDASAGEPPLLVASLIPLVPLPALLTPCSATGGRGPAGPVSRRDRPAMPPTPELASRPGRPVNPCFASPRLRCGV